MKTPIASTEAERLHRLRGIVERGSTAVSVPERFVRSEDAELPDGVDAGS